MHIISKYFCVFSDRRLLKCSHFVPQLLFLLNCCNLLNEEISTQRYWHSDISHRPTYSLNIGTGVGHKSEGAEQ